VNMTKYNRSTQPFTPLGAQQEDDQAEQLQPTREKVVQLLNQAQLVQRDKKLECLQQVKELIVHKDPDLLDSFLDEVMAFQQDTVADVRKLVVSIMEDACKTDPELMHRVIPMLAYMLKDNNPNVLKRVLACFIQLYRIAFRHIAAAKASNSDLQEIWDVLTEVKQQVLELIDSDNDGIRTLAIKFTEILIITQTKKEEGSEQLKLTDQDISLDIVPPTHPLLKASLLKEEAGTAMGSLLSLTASPTVSSVNLMACVGTLTFIAKQRPSYISTVVQSFELLHANLPPHFATSQVSSVRKQLKSQLLAILKHPRSLECQSQIATVLTDLGCTQAEIASNTPKPEQKRPRSSVDGDCPPPKKQRPNASGGNPKKDTAMPPLKPPPPDAPAATNAFMEAVEMTTTDIKPLLTPEVVTDLVLATMSNLPKQQPIIFKNSYTPIAAAASEAQVTHLARLLASQMTSAGIGVGAEAKSIKPTRPVPEGSSSQRSASPIVRDPRRRRQEEGLGRPAVEEPMDVRVKEEEEEEIEISNPNLELDLAQSTAELSYLGALLGLPSVLDPMFPVAYAAFFGSVPPTSAEPMEELSVVRPSNLIAIPTVEDPDDQSKDKEEKKKLQPVAPQKLKRIHMFDLTSVVHPMENEQVHSLAIAAFKRMLKVEGGALSLDTQQNSIKLIITLVTQFGGEFVEALRSFILEDFKSHFDLAIAWLYAEYSIEEGYVFCAQSSQHYETCLLGLLEGAKTSLDARDRLFTKLLLEAPRLTKPALEIVRAYCLDEERAFLGVSTLKDLVLKRHHASDECLQVLLQITLSDLEMAKNQSLHVVKKLYTVRQDLVATIERFAQHTLQCLLSEHPSFLQTEGDMQVATEWTEDSVKTCVVVFLALLPLNPKLLKDLAMVYTGTSATVKRILLKLIDTPVRALGMDSPDLLELVLECPHGSETLVIRMLYILTETAPPSSDLVNRVREVCQRSGDVRLLIPILHGLQKQEVIEALPKFIHLSPNLVKGVFDRLLVSYKGDQGHSISPVTPSELMIALHTLDFPSDESLMKAVIKATNLCFGEKAVYTQEVLAVVLQQLLDHTPIPTLFMRTVLQSLQAYPRLLNFVMTILNKLITKQVWKEPKVWQGFIKCCEVTKPQSFPVLLQLPTQQLKNILETSSVLNEALRNYLKELSPSQLIGMPRPLLQLLGFIEGEGGIQEGGDESKKQKSENRKLSKTDYDFARVQESEAS
ncbi:hypothetical protein EMCRGX_G032264, partial [Ephydatia muelleri]